MSMSVLAIPRQSKLGHIADPAEMGAQTGLISVPQMKSAAKLPNTQNGSARGYQELCTPLAILIMAGQAGG